MIEATRYPLAMIAQLMNIEMELILPGFNKERTEAYGATVIHRKTILGSGLCYKKVAEGGYIMLNQFANEG
jgi:cysteine synthase B